MIQPRWHGTSSYRIEEDGVETLVETPPKGGGFTEEIEEVHYCFRRHALQSEKWRLQHSLDLATLLDTVRDKVGLRFPFAVWLASLGLTASHHYHKMLLLQEAQPRPLGGDMFCFGF